MSQTLRATFVACLWCVSTAALATDWCTSDAKPKWAKLLPSWNDRRIPPMSSADADFGFEPTRVWCWAREENNSRDGWCIGLGNELCLQGGVDRSTVDAARYQRLHITNQDASTNRFLTLFYD
jgi:hypothetical protein